MTKSPGHRKTPDHQVKEVPVDQRYQVKVSGRIIAESKDVIRLEEDDHRPRYYFPRSDVRIDLHRTETTSECPYKGTASHFSIEVGETHLPEAAWSYEDPYDEHRALKDRVAFYDDKYAQINVSPAE